LDCDRSDFPLVLTVSPALLYKDESISKIVLELSVDAAFFEIKRKRDEHVRERINLLLLALSRQNHSACLPSSLFVGADKNEKIASFQQISIALLDIICMASLGSWQPVTHSSTETT
jgi:hypothetical protein